MMQNIDIHGICILMDTILIEDNMPRLYEEKSSMWCSLLNRMAFPVFGRLTCALQCTITLTDETTLQS